MRFTFNVKKAFLGHGDLTPEQRDVIDRLERGEITAAEAERLLGATVREWRLTLGEPADEDDAPPPPPRPAETDEERTARELVERVMREVDAENDG